LPPDGAAITVRLVALAQAWHVHPARPGHRPVMTGAFL
jgi:hypothetical protein